MILSRSPRRGATGFVHRWRQWLRSAHQFSPSNGEDLQLAAAIDAQYFRELAAARSWWAFGVFVLMGVLICGLVRVPGLQAVLRVEFRPTLVLVAAELLAALAAQLSYWRAGPRSRLAHWMLLGEGGVTRAVGVSFILLSGSAMSVFWFVILAQIANTSRRVRLKRQWLVVELGGIVALGAGFWWLGAPRDALLSVFFGTLALWLFLVWADGHCHLVRLAAERQVMEERLSQVLVERERERIARDLHDGIGAELTALVYQVRALRRDLVDEHARSELDTVVERARQNLDELRNVVWALQPKARDWPAVTARLRQRAQELCAAGPQLAFVDEGAAPGFQMPEAYALPALHMVQEMVRNAVRHAAAQRIEVRIGAAQHLCIEVRDDGRGLDESALEHSRGGLRNLRRRASLLDGTLRFHTGIDGQGVGIRVCLPLGEQPVCCERLAWHQAHDLATSDASTTIQPRGPDDD